ncbi:helix-turn-helix transcriptional regulator [Mycobacterium sp. E740]|uniref:helix-turn-helix transcriptional regulator n=1 Tax=Mycobacterium sp. E740 TaxID=1834149 RepID=UPI0012E9ECA6|nr:helix-turn-helix transcriptional regulator [Mycobacterium sp. E740]
MPIQVSRMSRYTGFFGADVKFGISPAALRVERRVLDERFLSANETIRTLAVEYLSGKYVDPSATMTSRVRSAVAERLGSSEPVIGSVARLLAMNPRTLQRRLVAEGTSYAAVLDSVRRDAAYRYITTTDMPFTQVAALVGFSEQSALTRAVRRWFGVGPRVLRSRPPVAQG